MEQAILAATAALPFDAAKVAEQSLVGAASRFNDRRKPIELTVTHRLGLATAAFATALAVLGAAIAVGLSAHLLGTGTSHDGAGRDLVVLGIDLIVTAVLCRRLTPKASILIALIVASSCVGVGWLFLENPLHVELGEVVTTVTALMPLLCVIVSAILFAAASVALTRVLLEIIRVAYGGASRLRGWSHSVDRNPKRIKDIRLRLRPRRGPPNMLLTPSRSL